MQVFCNLRSTIIFFPRANSTKAASAGILVTPREEEVESAKQRGFGLDGWKTYY
jgi:hypothetical protein